MAGEGRDAAERLDRRGAVLDAEDALAELHVRKGVGEGAAGNVEAVLDLRDVLEPDVEEEAVVGRGAVDLGAEALPVRKEGAEGAGNAAALRLRGRVAQRRRVLLDGQEDGRLAHLRDVEVGEAGGREWGS